MSVPCWFGGGCGGGEDYVFLVLGFHFGVEGSEGGVFVGLEDQISEGVGSAHGDCGGVDSVLRV